MQVRGHLRNESIVSIDNLPSCAELCKINAHAGLHLFDSLIIVTTFVLEVILKGRERELAGLLIVLRLWRLVKLVGG